MKMINQPNSKDILINITPFQKRIVVRHKKQISEVFYQQPSDVVLLDSIYKGIVTAIIPSLNAAFVDIGADKTGFLHVDDIELFNNNYITDSFVSKDGQPETKPITKSTKDIQSLLKEGQEILVQVTKEPINTKGARLSMQICLLGRFLIGLPNVDFVGVSKKSRDFEKRREMIKVIKKNLPGNMGFIVRTLGLEEDEKEIKKEIQILVDRWQFCQEHSLQMEEPGLIYQNSNLVETTLRDYFSDDVEKIIVDNKKEYRNIIDYLKILSPDMMSRVEVYSSKEPIFDFYGIEDELSKAFESRINIKGGGYLIIEQTEALVSIDVNTGGRIKIVDQAKNNFGTNIAAAHEICKQMRLRDLGGIIVIDFIDMNSEDDIIKLENEFRKGIISDRTPVNFTNITDLGLMEVTRKRVRLNLTTNQSKICPTCRGNRFIPNLDNLLANIDRGIYRINSLKKYKHIILAVHFKICAILTEQRGEIIKYWETHFGIQIDLYEDEAIEYPNYRIFTADKGIELTQKSLSIHNLRKQIITNKKESYVKS